MSCNLFLELCADRVCMDRKRIVSAMVCFMLSKNFVFDDKVNSFFVDCIAMHDFFVEVPSAKASCVSFFYKYGDCLRFLGVITATCVRQIDIIFLSLLMEKICKDILKTKRKFAPSWFGTNNNIII